MTLHARKRQRDVPLLEAAGRGALAGLVGGVAMTVLDRAVMPRVGGRATPDREWDRQVTRGARRAGVRLAGSRRTAAGIATTLAYGALVGAVYGVARMRLRDLDAASGVLDAGLVYAATLVAGDPLARGRGIRGKSPRARGVRRAMEYGSGPAVFGRATMAAFRALTR